jgi:hypothetical protein
MFGASASVANAAPSGTTTAAASPWSGTITYGGSNHYGADGNPTVNTYSFTIGLTGDNGRVALFPSAALNVPSGSVREPIQILSGTNTATASLQNAGPGGEVCTLNSTGSDSFKLTPGFPNVPLAISYGPAQFQIPVPLVNAVGSTTTTKTFPDCPGTAGTSLDDFEFGFSGCSTSTVNVSDLRHIIGSCTYDHEDPNGIDYNRAKLSWDLTLSPTADSDGDGCTDVEELGAGTSPVDASSHDASCGENGTVVAKLITDPHGENGVQFSGPVSALLGDGGQHSAQVPPGTYPETVTPPAGWVVQTVTCNPGDPYQPGSNTGVFHVTSGQTTICAFVLQKAAGGSGGPIHDFCLNGPAQAFGGTTSTAVGVGGGFLDKAEGFLTSIGRSAASIAKAAGRVALVGSGVGFLCSFYAKAGSPPFAQVACRELSAISLGLAVATVPEVVSVVGAPAAVVTAPGSVVSGVAGAIACLADPPDKHFRQIAKPHIVRVVVNANLRAAERKALLGILAPAARIDGYAQAAALCIDRATGATAAHATVWARRQHVCAAQYARQVSDALRTLVPRSKSLARWLRADHASNPTIRPAEVVAALDEIDHTYRGQMVKQGVNGALLDALYADRSSIANKIPHLSIDAMIAGPTMISALRAVATRFDQIARAQERAAR